MAGEPRGLVVDCPVFVALLWENLLKTKHDTSALVVQASPLWVTLPYLSLFASGHAVTQSNSSGRLFVFSARLSGRPQPIA